MNMTRRTLLTGALAGAAANIAGADDSKSRLELTVDAAKQFDLHSPNTIIDGVQWGNDASFYLFNELCGGSPGGNLRVVGRTEEVDHGLVVDVYTPKDFAGVWMESRLNHRFTGETDNLTDPATLTLYDRDTGATRDTPFGVNNVSPLSDGAKHLLSILSMDRVGLDAAVIAGWFPTYNWQEVQNDMEYIVGAFRGRSGPHSKMAIAPLDVPSKENSFTVSRVYGAVVLRADPTHPEARDLGNPNQDLARSHGWKLNEAFPVLAGKIEMFDDGHVEFDRLHVYDTPTRGDDMEIKHLGSGNKVNGSQQTGPVYVNAGLVKADREKLYGHSAFKTRE